jgi:carboxylesterase type B
MIVFTWTSGYLQTQQQLPNSLSKSGYMEEVKIAEGFNPLYNRCNLAKAGSLLVSINHRLGPLGFLAVEDSSALGNQGIKDILLGLQWIQDNIAAFGGSPVSILVNVL